MQFKLNLPAGEFVFPEKPVTIPADEFFFWPFNLDLGGAKLIYATAQPVCRMGDSFYFAETPGVKAEFVFDPQTLAGQASAQAVFNDVKSGRAAAIRLQTKSGTKIRIVLLNEADSLALRKDDGSGVTFEKPLKIAAMEVKAEPLRPAGPAREIPLSHDKSPVAIAPNDADFTNAAVWKITLPENLDRERNPLLRIRYVGDVARLTLNGKLLDDNFYSGREFDLGLKRYAPDILHGDLRLEILPLRQDAPIFLEPKARPDFGGKEALVNLQSLEIINR